MHRPKRQNPPQSLSQSQQSSPGPQTPLPQVLHWGQEPTHSLLARFAQMASQEVEQQKGSAGHTQPTQEGPAQPGVPFAAQQSPW
jgi:hypothetical protein